MAVQFSTVVRNARLDAIENAIGTSAILAIYTGSKPTDCATASSGTQLVSINLPSDWMNNAANGSKGGVSAFTGTATAAGTAGYFRIFNSAGSVCHLQGTVTANGSGGDLTFDNPTFAQGQGVTIGTFAIFELNS